MMLSVAVAPVISNTSADLKHVYYIKNSVPDHDLLAFCHGHPSFKLSDFRAELHGVC